MELEVTESGKTQDGLATRTQFRVRVTNRTGSCAFDLLLFLPLSPRPVPVFLGLNFNGNQGVESDPAIAIPGSWRWDIARELANDGRGSEASRYPVDLIAQSGFGVATVYAGDFAPDDPAHVGEGILRLLPEPASPQEANVRGGAIAAWAWGLSRALDALLTLPEVDASRVAVIGHSRMGKTALWAGALDERFALVVSNNSGCGGAALSRRRFGERLVHINNNNPHWFARAFRQYNEREQDLPVDQHQLMASIAPRALYVASANEDQWADPRGEYLALAAAAPAWDEKLPAEMPPLDQPVFGRGIGYHVRAGKHDLTAYDWQQFLAFADARL